MWNEAGADPAAREARGKDLRDAFDARHGERRFGVEGLHLAIGDRAAHDHRRQHVGPAEVGGIDIGAIDRLAGDHVVGVDERHGLLLFDETPLRRLLERGLGFGLGGHFDFLGEQQQLAVIEGVTTATHLVLFRLVILDVAPVQEDRGAQHHETNTGAEDPHGGKVDGHAARAVRELGDLIGNQEARLAAWDGVRYREPGAIGIGLVHLNPGPVGLELVGQHRRQTRADALAHLRAEGRDDDRTVELDADEVVEREAFVEDLANRLFGLLEDRFCRGEAAAEHQRAGAHAELTEEIPASDPEEAAHDLLPAALWIASRIRG